MWTFVAVSLGAWRLQQSWMLVCVPQPQQYAQWQSKQENMRPTSGAVMGHRPLPAL